MIHVSQCDTCGYRTSQSCGEPPHYGYDCEASSGCRGRMIGLGVSPTPKDRSALYHQVALYATELAVAHDQLADAARHSAHQTAIRGTAIHESMERFDSAP